MATNDSYIGSPDNPRTTAWVCYITFIGWLIAYFGLYRTNKTSFAGFHIRQSLLIHIISLALKTGYSFCRSNAAFFIVTILAVVLFMLWLIGLWDSLNDRQKPLPFIGSAAQKLFKAL